MKTIKSVIFRCVFCDSPLENTKAVCSECERKIKANFEKNKCIKCGRTVETNNTGICLFCKRVKPKFDMSFCVLPYKGVFSKTIKELKFRYLFYKLDAVSNIVLRYIESHHLHIDCICYVPSGFKSHFERKYCLAQELALYLGKHLNLPVYGGLLKLPGRKSQYFVEFDERFTNVKGAFIKRPFYPLNVKGKTVLLADDVLTTGSTMSECAKILKEQGANVVYGCAIASAGADL